MHRAHILRRACKLLSSGEARAAAEDLQSHYPVAGPQTTRSTWSRVRLTRLFVRDGFTDRYFGELLVFPGALRALTLLLPEQIPYHRNWKQSETHPAYWEVYPTLDHVIPVARGGANDESNAITTSMVRNAAKSNWQIEELGWPAVRAPVASDWDGLLPWFMRTFERVEIVRNDAAARAWHSAGKSAT